MSTEIFKVGDPVFDINIGWGEIKTVTEISISVLFDGRKNYTDYVVFSYISFTEYDLISGGWSQDRSVLNQPKKGDLVYVRDQTEIWEMRFYSHKEGIRYHCFHNQKKEGRTCEWSHLEVENPLLKEEE